MRIRISSRAKISALLPRRALAWLASVIACFVWTATGICEDAAPAARAPTDELTFQTVTSLPPGYPVLPPDPDPQSLIVYTSKIQRNAYWYDAKPWLTSMGLPFPDRAVAIYSPLGHTLCVRNTSDNLDMFAAIFSGCYGSIFNVTVEIQVFECASSLDALASKGKWPEYSDLKALPPDKIRQLSRVALFSPSGKPASASNFTQSGDRKCRTKAKVEPTAGPDGFSFSTPFTFAFRAETPGSGVFECNYTGTFTSQDNNPVIVYACPMIGNQDASLIVVATASPVDLDGTRISENVPTLEPLGDGK